MPTFNYSRMESYLNDLLRKFLSTVSIALSSALIRISLYKVLSEEG